jgi:TrmH family RNA methyltransferase
MSEERIVSAHNALLVHLRKLLSSRAYREKSGQFAADGTKLLAEAAKWYPGLRAVVAEEGVSLCPLPAGVRVARVSEGLMKSVSQMEAPEGAIFICDLPAAGTAEIRPGTILLDGIQDPGNLGTILRTADALGIPAVLLEGCADPWNPKTVRASMGAVLRAIPASMTADDAVRACREAGIPLFAAAMGPDARDVRTLPLASSAVVVGSEGQGVRQSLLQAADGCAVIPMNPRCESLNAAAAAAILMWQMKA